MSTPDHESVEISMPFSAETLSFKENLDKSRDSELWAVFDRVKKRRLVLKRFRRSVFDSNGGKGRFDLDFRAYQSATFNLSSPDFPRILESGEDETWFWFLRESFGENKSLFETVHSGKILRPLEVLKRFWNLSALLVKLHGMKLLHRAMSPGSLLLSGTDRLQLVDPDVGHFLDPAVFGQVLDPESLGWSDFLAPEQKSMGRELGPQTDIFSFAASLAYAIEGCTPLNRNQPDQPTIPQELTAFLQKAMQEDPQKRYVNMEEVRFALNHLLKSLQPTLFATTQEGSTTVPDQNVTTSSESVDPSDVSPLSPTNFPTNSLSSPTSHTNSSTLSSTISPTMEINSSAASSQQGSSEQETDSTEREDGLSLSPISAPTSLESGISQPISGGTPGSAELRCPQCSTPVQPNYRVCPQCSRPYEEPCLVCQSPNPFWAPTCSSCNTDLMLAKQMMRDRLSSQQQQILKWREHYEHDKALPLLKQMTLLTHPDLTAFRDWAKNLFPIMQVERRDIRMRVEGIRLQAKAFFEEQKYEKVQETLAQIPPALVNDELRKMYQEAGECMIEVNSLVQEIRNSIATKKYNTLLSCVHRYLELKANDPEAKNLQQKIEKLTTITTSGGMKLRRIPPGRFYMGSHESDEFIRNNERPQHRVSLSHSFFMGVYPVTQGEFLRLMGFNPSLATEDMRCPVDNVSWYTALEFCNKMCDEEGLPRYYELTNIKRRSTHNIEYADVRILGGEGFRLPTEAEWEYTCRSGSITPWFHGDLLLDVGQYAWYYDNAQMETHAVGGKKPNAWGLYDMHGNVLEWCYDWYNEFYYQQCPEEENPIGPETGTAKSLRGGAWQFGAEATRSAYRNSCSPETSSSVIGFRVARNAGDDTPLG
ncbi:MAG: SUMF1/EgtB/PvdO family nonheme iron enzyme [Thermoguttaceae bacterium]